MRRAMYFLVLTCFSALLAGCNDSQQVNASERDALAKIKSGQYELVSKAELQELRAAAATAKAVGRFQLYRDGLRTWRLDTATGTTCIFLAAKADWDNPETQSQRCEREQRDLDDEIMKAVQKAKGAATPAAPANPFRKTVRMKAPTGEIKDVPQNQVSHYLSKGAVVVEQSPPEKVTVEELPQRAAAQLKEGQNTTFANGQTWTLKNGRAVRVKSEIVHFVDGNQQWDIPLNQVADFKRNHPNARRVIDLTK